MLGKAGLLKMRSCASVAVSIQSVKGTDRKMSDDMNTLNVGSVTMIIGIGLMSINNQA